MADKNRRAGQQLARLRLRRGLTMQQVFELSQEVAALRGKSDFLLPPSRLSEIESKGVTPTIYKLYAMSVIYECSLRKLPAFYGIA